MPNGDLHKCWDTVSSPERRVGTVFKPEELAHDPLMERWLRWNPLEDPRCRTCKILPGCAGACAYKFVHAETTRGEAAALPCLSWRYNIKERLVFRARAMGKIGEADVDVSELVTDPHEICPDDQGLSAPQESAEPLVPGPSLQP